MYIAPTRHTDKVSMINGPANDDEHAKLTYDICQCINTLTLRGVIDRLCAEGKLHPNTGALLFAQAQTLRALLLTENNRVHGF